MVRPLSHEIMLISILFSGDSYSSVGYSYDAPPPTASQPLGVSFPGHTYNEPGLPNWVGHMITTYAPEPRFVPFLKGTEQDGRCLESPLLVYSYAEGGSTMENVREQIQYSFLPTVQVKGNWDNECLVNTLFSKFALPYFTCTFQGCFILILQSSGLVSMILGKWIFSPSLD